MFHFRLASQFVLIKEKLKFPETKRRANCKNTAIKRKEKKKKENENLSERDFLPLTEKSATTAANFIGIHFPGRKRDACREWFFPREENSKLKKERRGKEEAEVSDIEGKSSLGKESCCKSDET